MVILGLKLEKDVFTTNAGRKKKKAQACPSIPFMHTLLSDLVSFELPQVSKLELR